MMSRAAAREIENLAPSLYSTAMTSMPALRLKGCGGDAVWQNMDRPGGAMTIGISDTTQ